MKSARRPAATDAAAIVATDRLRLRLLTLDDAPFILRLVNEPSWLEFIGDKNVRNEDDARAYLAQGPLDMYAKLGFGKGYAHEAARAVLAHARNDYALKRIVAITSPGNRSSIRLLEKLGMKLEQELDLPRDGGKSLVFGRRL